jgi:hypothetical protein
VHLLRLHSTRRRWLSALVALSTAAAVACGFGISGALASTPSSTPAAKTLAAQHTITPVISCASITSEVSLLGLGGENASITSATSVAASANPVGDWAGCEVQGIIAPETHFAIYLPASTYAGEYLQEGCGGYCGAVEAGQPAASTGCLAATDGNFAVGTDDEGHEGGSFIAPAFQDPELKAVFGYESEHQLAVVAKALIKDVYGRAPAESYYDGCSQGGHEALIEAQRYPADFNGIIAGSPASIMTELNAFMQAWNAQANTGANGTAILTAADLAPLHNAVLQACGGATAVSLGYLSNPQACTWQPSSIECEAGQTSTESDFCLTAAQVETVDKLYSGPTDTQGQLLYPGYETRGSELNWIGWIVPATGDQESTSIDASIATGTWEDVVTPNGVFNGNASYTDVRFTKAEFKEATADDGELDATDPNLSAFEKAGGKLILWAGYADPAISPVGTLSYYQAVIKTMGGLNATDKFARLFLLPGVAHCGGGQGPSTFDALTAITEWVTQGKAPSSLLTSLVSQTGKVTATRPAYPYPYIAVDTTGGSPTSASSYTPQVSTAELDSNVHWLGSFRSGYETVSSWVNGQWITRPANLRH